MACFGGEFVQGFPCQSDGDCGPRLSCNEGLCGGVGGAPLCGNWLMEAGEQCDDGNTDEHDECTPACRLPVCGDGFIGPDEECDDGDTLADETCTADCQLPSVCGDGVIEPGEECDDGSANGPSSSCTAACTLAACGDGLVGPGEECDDANEDDTDSCTVACAFPACGDGVVNSPSEACDDGNGVETDACTTACTLSPEVPVLELSFSQVKQFEFSWQPVLGAEYYQLLERADVGEDFSPVGEDIEGESVALTVSLVFGVNASYKLRACNGEGCSESEVVDVAGTLADAM